MTHSPTNGRDLLPPANGGPVGMEGGTRGALSPRVDARATRLVDDNAAVSFGRLIAALVAAGSALLLQSWPTADVALLFLAMSLIEARRAYKRTHTPAALPPVVLRDAVPVRDGDRVGAPSDTWSRTVGVAAGWDGTNP